MPLLLLPFLLDISVNRETQRRSHTNSDDAIQVRFLGLLPTQHMSQKRMYKWEIQLPTGQSWPSAKMKRARVLGI